MMYVRAEHWPDYIWKRRARATGGAVVVPLVKIKCTYLRYVHSWTGPIMIYLKFLHQLQQIQSMDLKQNLKFLLTTNTRGSVTEVLRFQL